VSCRSFAAVRSAATSSLSEGGAAGDDFDLRVLIGGNKAVEIAGASDFWRGGDGLDHRRGISRRGQRIDGIDNDARFAVERAQRYQRLGISALQAVGIEVELQLEQERRAARCNDVAA
jgi:hypothetical protein